MAVTVFQVVCLFGLFGNVISGSGLDTTLTYSGSFEIRIKDKPWFESAPPFVVANGTRYSTRRSSYSGRLPPMDEELVLKSTEPREDSDDLGQFKAMKYVYFAGDTRMDLDIRAYSSVVVFAQTFPNGLQNPGVPDQRKVLSGFPALQWDIVFLSYTASGYLTFLDHLAGDSSVTLDRWDPMNIIPDGIRASGPLCLFNVTSNDAVVISPLTQAMHVSPWHRRWVVHHYLSAEAQSYWGLDRDLTSLPSGFKVEVILVYSPDGIGKALEQWGTVYRHYNRPPSPTPAPSLDATVVDRLGYWTGQGSYYYNSKITTNTTYEDILLGVERQASNHSVPLGFFELDKWWYEAVNGTPEAVVTWEANSQSLPDGIRSLHQGLGVPLAAVLGWWSSDTTYAEQNNGSYTFIMEGQYALPMQKEFWSDLFQNASQNGITHVILDNLETQYNGISALQTQTGLASDWLKNVSSAAYEAGITLTLSQALPRMLMEASKYPAVVQVRVSSPYMETNTTEQWKIGVTSALAGALGLAAFKDTFWSHAQETGNAYGDLGREWNPDLQALVATLSMGSVVLGDREDFLESSPSDRCCRSDGVVLKPSQPARAMDKQLVHTAINSSHNLVGQLWSTVSTLDVITYYNVTDLYNQGVILAADMPARPFNITPSEAFPGVYNASEVARNLRAWSWINGQEMFWTEFSDQKPLSYLPGQCDVTTSPALPCVFYVSPPLILDSGEITVYLGGENKYVPLSRQRVKAINITIGVTLTLQGQPGENVTMFYYVNDRRHSFDVIIDPDGVTDVVLDVPSVMSTSSASVTSEPVTKPPRGPTTSGPTGVAVTLRNPVSLSTFCVALSYAVVLLF